MSYKIVLPAYRTSFWYVIRKLEPEIVTVMPKQFLLHAITNARFAYLPRKQCPIMIRRKSSGTPPKIPTILHCCVIISCILAPPTLSAYLLKVNIHVEVLTVAKEILMLGEFNTTFSIKSLLLALVNILLYDTTIRFWKLRLKTCRRDHGSRTMQRMMMQQSLASCLVDRTRYLGTLEII